MANYHPTCLQEFPNSIGFDSQAINPIFFLLHLESVYYHNNNNEKNFRDSTRSKMGGRGKLSKDGLFFSTKKIKILNTYIDIYSPQQNKKQYTQYYATRTPTHPYI